MKVESYILETSNKSSSKYVRIKRVLGDDGNLFVGQYDFIKDMNPCDHDWVHHIPCLKPEYYQCSKCNLRRADRCKS